MHMSSSRVICLHVLLPYDLHSYPGGAGTRRLLEAGTGMVWHLVSGLQTPVVSGRRAVDIGQTLSDSQIDDRQIGRQAGRQADRCAPRARAR